jgi:hypothetical protein
MRHSMNMPASIPTEIQDSVVQSWFCGLSRRPNAVKHNVSEGSVDNFVKDWKYRHGPDGEYERLRALAVATSKSGLSVQDCAQGHRIVMIMKNIGVSEDDYEIFISKLSKRYVAPGLRPDTLVEQINQLHFFLENNQSYIGTTTTTLSQLLEIFKSKLDEIRDLELKKQNLEKTIRELYIDKETIEAELNWDSELKEMLNKHGFKKEDVPKFVDAALLMKGRRYNIFDIMERFSRFEEIEDACFSVQRKKVDLEQRHDHLLGENQHLEVQISQNSLKFRDLDSLKALGFGLAEFRMLRDIITEVGEERGLIGNDAVKDFFQDLENHYYEYRRLRTSVSKLKAEKAQASAVDTSNQILGMFQNFFKQRSESLSESNPKYNLNTEVSAGEKKVKHVDNNDVASNHGPNSELQSE